MWTQGQERWGVMFQPWEDDCPPVTLSVCCLCVTKCRRVGMEEVESSLLRIWGVLSEPPWECSSSKQRLYGDAEIF